jgi:prophage DNA circulation protein
VASWRDGLRPASFRGVAFNVDEHELEGGRRVAIYEFPFRDDPDTRDLGRKVRHYHVTAYVLGDDYFARRDALLAALDGSDQPGTLVHPYLGTKSVRCDAFRLRETKAAGRLATFTIAFCESGVSPSPQAVTDTASAVLARCDDANAALVASFGSLFAVSGVAQFVQQAAAALTVGFNTAAQVLRQVNQAITQPLATLASLTGTGSSASAIGGAVTGLFGAFTAAVLAARTVATNIAAITEASSRGGFAFGADLTFGLAGFALYGFGFPPIQLSTSARAIQAGNQQAFLDLVRGGAVIGIAQLYAATDFDSAADAENARDQLTGMIDAEAEASAAAGDGALYESWQALYAAVSADLTTRGKSLPDLMTYTTASSLPALVLAQRLYQDAARAQELVARNAAPHPGFMPLSGEALSS